MILNQFWKMFNQQLSEKSFLLAIKHNSHKERKRIVIPKKRKYSELQAKGDHLSSRSDTLTTELSSLYRKQGQIHYVPFLIQVICFSHVLQQGTVIKIKWNSYKEIFPVIINNRLGGSILLFLIIDKEF